MAFCIIVNFKAHNNSASLCKIERNSVEYAVHIVEHIDHALHGDVAFAYLGNSVYFAVKEVTSKLHAAEFHDGTVMFGLFLNGDHAVIFNCDTD